MAPTVAEYSRRDGATHAKRHVAVLESIASPVSLLVDCRGQHCGLHRPGPSPVDSRCSAPAIIDSGGQEPSIRASPLPCPTQALQQPGPDKRTVQLRDTPESKVTRPKLTEAPPSRLLLRLASSPLLASPLSPRNHEHLLRSTKHHPRIPPCTTFRSTQATRPSQSNLPHADAPFADRWRNRTKRP